MIVIFLHGPPAASKYNVGKALSALLGIPLFHNHLTLDLVKALFDFGTPGFVALREQVWRVAFEAAAATGQSFIFTFNPASGRTSDWVRSAVHGSCGDAAGEFQLWHERQKLDVRYPFAHHDLYLHPTAKVSKERVMVRRTASSYTMPPPGMTAAEHPPAEV
jgi:hypothetical protein